jgi:glycosyltransferase involved in cell wall biosynthesis
MKLSIIVPVYNVEKYLRKCLDSLLNQDISMEDYEIIIVDDESTDGGLTIASSYAEKYNNIKLITQKNKGLGGARNTGIRNAKGKYLFFVDSDDYILQNSLGQLLNTIENNKLDALRFNYQKVDQDGNVIPKTEIRSQNAVYSELTVDGPTFMAEYFGWACYVCVFIFDKELIINNNLFFDEGILFEDIDWIPLVLEKVNRIQSLDLEIYKYFQRTGSITQSVDFDKKNKVVTDKLTLIKKLKALSLGTLNNNVKLWCEGMVSIIVIGVLSHVSAELPERRGEAIQTLRDINVFPITPRNFTFKQYRNVVLINFSPLIFCYLKLISVKTKVYISFLKRIIRK